MARNTERVELDGGAWAEMDRELNDLAFRVATESFSQHERLTTDALCQMVLASVTAWSFDERVSMDVLNYSVNARQGNQMRQRVVQMFVEWGGGGIEVEEEKKD